MGTPNRKGLGNISALCLVVSTKARNSNLLAESEPVLVKIFCAPLSKIRAYKCPFYSLPAGGRSRWDPGLTATKMKHCHWVKSVMVGG
jgi:hypothetical protein